MFLYLKWYYLIIAIVVVIGLGILLFKNEIKILMQKIKDRKAKKAEKAESDNAQADVSEENAAESAEKQIDEENVAMQADKASLDSEMQNKTNNDTLTTDNAEIDESKN